MQLKASLFDENAINRAIIRISHEILEHNSDLSNLCLVGIKTRGIPIANRLSENIFKIEGKKIEVGALDITLYRDDLTLVNQDAVVNSSNIPFDISGKAVILADDVIYTGRTVRAAMDAIIELGRPSSIQLAVLVDRGHREFPIRPDYVGKNVPTSGNEIVQVHLTETDEENSIKLYSKI